MSSLTFGEVLQKYPTLLIKSDRKTPIRSTKTDQISLLEEEKKQNLKEIKEEIKGLFEPCKHKEIPSNCLACQYLDLMPTTDHEYSRTLYLKFSIPFRRAYDDKSNTLEQIELHKLDLKLNGKRIIWKKEAGDLATLLYYLDNAQERYPSDSEIRIINYLASSFFNTGRAKEPLTKSDLYDLERERKHVFKWQLEKIKDRCKWILKFEGSEE